MPDILPTLLTLLCGIALGAAITYHLSRQSLQRTQHACRLESAPEKAILTERLISREAQITELRQSLADTDANAKKWHERAADLQTQLSKLEVRREAEEKAATEKITFYEKARENLTNTFKALASESLKNNHQSFINLAQGSFEKLQEAARGDLEQRRQAIGQLIKPLSESLGKVEENIQLLEKNRAGAYAGLNQQIKNLMDSQVRLQAETANLVQALRTPNVRGRWGELQLERAVEFAGMVEYCDFVQQESHNGSEGTSRPDMIVRLPNGRNLVIDAKAPLDAYLDALREKEAGATHTALLRKHARHIRDHITQLNSRGYWKQFSPTPEFVILFIPGEAFFSAALEHDPSLIEYGIDERVLLATPTTLIALLKAVAYGWQQEKLTRHAEHIRDLGRELYERVATLGSHFADLGKSLGKSVESYNRTLGSLESRVLVTTRKFKALGSGAKAKLQSLTPLDKRPVLPKEAK